MKTMWKMKMKPSVGRIVLTPVAPETNNGSTVAPAIITRVWSDTCVNLRVLHDSENITWKTSVKLCESEAEAHDPDAFGHTAYWPPRV